MSRTLLAFALLLVAGPPAQAQTVFGCAEDGLLPPDVVFTLKGQFGDPLGRYNSATDDRLRLPTHLQKPLPNGAFFLRYNGADRREAYGVTAQDLTVHFKGLGPLKQAKKHAAGDVILVPVGGDKPVEFWTGTASFLTLFGRVLDPGQEDECFWFYDVPIEWVVETEVPAESTSFGRVKALY